MNCFRLFCWSLVPIALAVCGVVTGCGQREEETAPPKVEIASRPDIANLDVVVLVIDTLRADHLPCYGYGKDTAPFLCGLAERGVLFERAYSPSSYTAPATASVSTGVLPSRHGLVTGFRAFHKLSKKNSSLTMHRIPESLYTLGEFYRDLGFATFSASDNLNICEEMGFDQGFDRFATFLYEGAEKLNHQALEWKDELGAVERSFLYLHYMDPHKPYNEQEPWFEPVPNSLKNRINAYDSEINFVDAHIAELYSTLGWDRNTVIIVLSDHGEEFLEHGGSGHGSTLYREAIHVPFIVIIPEWQPGVRVSECVSTLDLAPTLADFYGMDPRPEWEGRSLVPLMRGMDTEDRPIFSELLRQAEDTRPRVRSVLLAGRHLLRGTSKNRPTELDELYDLGADPAEKHNLLDEDPEAASDLRVILQAFIDRESILETESYELEMDPETYEHLKTLGYVH